MSRLTHYSLLVLAVIGILTGSCATYKTVTFRSPQVISFDEAPPIDSVARVYYRTYDQVAVDSTKWVTGGLLAFSENECVGKLHYGDIDSIMTRDGRSFTLLPMSVFSIDSVYHSGGRIDRVGSFRWIDGRLETFSMGLSHAETYRYSTWAADSLAVTFRKIDIRRTGALLLGIAAYLFVMTLY